MVRPIPLQQRMREMSSRMVEATNASQSDVSYDPDFVLHTNGGVQNIAAFRAGHERVHATGSRCAVAYDKDAWVAHGDRLGARLWVTIGPRGPVTREDSVGRASAVAGPRWEVRR